MAIVRRRFVICVILPLSLLTIVTLFNLKRILNLDEAPKVTHLAIEYDTSHRSNIIQENAAKNNNIIASTSSALTTQKHKAKYVAYIPPLLHFSFGDQLAPIEYKALLENCLKINSDMQVILWTDSLATRFLKEHYPTYLAKFQSYRRALEKSDMLRYFILHYYGGVYLDLDTVCKQPLIEGLKKMNVTCIFNKERTEITNVLLNDEYNVGNAAMACRPGHPFLTFIFDALFTTPDGGTIMHSTGPIFLTKHYKLWAEKVKKEKADESNNVVIAHPEVFSPNIPISLKDHCKNYQSQKHRKHFYNGCKSLDEHNFSERPEVFDNNRTLSRHLYLNLGYEEQQHRINKRFNISSTFLQLHFYPNITSINVS